MVVVVLVVVVLVVVVVRLTGDPALEDRISYRGG
jgi:hypothetical protein